MSETPGFTIPKQIHGPGIRVRQAVLDASKHHWAIRLRAGDWAELYGRRGRQEAHYEIEVRSTCHHWNLDDLGRCQEHPVEGFDIADNHVAERFGPAIAALLPDDETPEHRGGWVALTYTVVDAA